MARKNNREYREGSEFTRLKQMYLDRLISMALAQFEYENLPDDEMTSTVIEKNFVYNGNNAFTEVADRFVVLPFEAKGMLDVNGFPNKIEMHSRYNGSHLSRDKGKYVAGWDNVGKMSILPTLTEYASMLARIEIVTRVNIDAQMTPWIVKTTNKALLSALNNIEQIRSGERVVVQDSMSNPVSVEVLKTDAPFLADKLRALGRQTWNEALGYLGIGSIDNDSRERLVVAEVRTANSSVHASLHSRYQSRVEWVNAINTKYGTNIIVKCRDIWCDGKDVNGEEQNDDIHTNT